MLLNFKRIKFEWKIPLMKASVILIDSRRVIEIAILTIILILLELLKWLRVNIYPWRVVREKVILPIVDIIMWLI